MTRDELIARLAHAIAEQEGFFITEAQAKARGIRYPTRAQINANPGNIRAWKNASGTSYPIAGGYVDCVAWAAAKFPGASHEEISRRALDEGWRILRVLIGQYLNGRYTSGKPPTLAQMFKVYAPSADGNQPAAYARFVASRLGVPEDKPLNELITA
jgi:hypothetical protein